MTATSKLSSSELFLHDLWARQQAWSKAANRAKKQVETYRRWVLILIVVAACTGTSAPTIADLNLRLGRIAGVVAGIALAILPFVRRRLGVPSYQTWSRLRSVSESIKQEVYTYLAGASPYRGDDRVQQLRDRTDALLGKSGDLVRFVLNSDMGRRALPPVTDVETYLKERVERQINEYYGPQAQEMRRRARVVRRILYALGPLAGVLGVLAGFVTTEFAPWTGVIGTISGAVIAYSAAARYSFLELEYARTADQLTRLITDYRISTLAPADRDDWFVNECERVISYQNQEWMAEIVVARHGDAEASISDPQQI